MIYEDMGLTEYEDRKEVQALTESICIAALRTVDSSGLLTGDRVPMRVAHAIALYILGLDFPVKRESVRQAILRPSPYGGLEDASS